MIASRNSRDRIRIDRVVWLMLFLVLSFSIFRYFPGLQITSDAWIVIMALIFPFIIVYKFMNPNDRFSGIERYSIAILLIIPIIAAITSWQVFGQPVLYGLLAQRGLLLVGCAFLLSQWLRSGRIRAIELESAFKKLAWINIALCAPALLFLDPNNFDDLPGFVTEGGGIHNQFILPGSFIIIGFFYYALVGLRHQRMKMSLLSMPFFIYIVVGNSGRVVNISLVATYLIFLVALTPRSSLITKIFKIGVIGIILAAAIQIILPEKIPSMAGKYADAFDAVLTNEEVSDPSANARVLQTAIVIPFVLNYPIFGTGIISNRWNDGYKGLFGYLYPDDLGFLGVIFVYGLFGSLLFSYQFVLAWKVTRFLRAPRAKISDIYYAITAYLIFFYLTSVTSGSYVFWCEQPIMLLSILHWGSVDNTKAHYHDIKLNSKII
jgi:hypothetical protein